MKSKLQRLLFYYLVSTKNVHNRNGSGDSLHGEKRGHGNHGSSAILQLYLLVSGVLLGGHFRLHAKVVKVEVAHIRLAGFSTEAVTSVPYRFTFGDRNEGKDNAKPDRLFSSENSKSLGPVGLLGESREVKTKSKPTLHNSQIHYLQNFIFCSV